MVARDLGELNETDLGRAWAEGLEGISLAPRKFEALVQVVEYARAVLGFGMSSDEMEALFRKTKNHTRAAFLFCLASDLRQIPSSLHAALDHLEDCMNLLPSEASFHFFKGRWLDLWLDQGILLARALNLPVAEELAATDSVKAWVIESYERAVELEPDWDEPREKLRSLQSE